MTEILVHTPDGRLISTDPVPRSRIRMINNDYIGTAYGNYSHNWIGEKAVVKKVFGHVLTVQWDCDVDGTRLIHKSCVEVIYDSN